MENKTTKILARNDYERAVLLRLFIPGTDLPTSGHGRRCCSVPLCYGFLAPTWPQVERYMAKGRAYGREEGTWHRPRSTMQRARGNLDGTSGRYMWEVHVDGMAKQMGKEPSYPTRPLYPYLSCRRDAGLSHSPPNRVQQAPRWMSERGYLAGPGGQAGQGAQARSAVSFCKWHGGSVARLRAVGEAKDVIVQLLPPSEQKYLLSTDVVGRLACWVWDIHHEVVILTMISWPHRHEDPAAPSSPIPRPWGMF